MSFSNLFVFALSCNMINYFAYNNNCRTKIGLSPICYPVKYISHANRDLSLLLIYYSFFRACLCLGLSWQHPRISWHVDCTMINYFAYDDVYVYTLKRDRRLFTATELFCNSKNRCGGHRVEFDNILPSNAKEWTLRG